MNTNFTIHHARNIEVEVCEYESSNGAFFTIGIDVTDFKNDVSTILIYTDDKSIADHWAKFQSINAKEDA